MRSGRKKRDSFFSKAILSFFFITLCTLPYPSHARTDLALGDRELTDEQLAGVTAQSGISINFDITQNVTIETVAWGDSDGYSGSSGAGWIGYRDLEIDQLHIWPRTDYSMDGSNWNKLELLTLDVVTLDDPETSTDFGELYGLDRITKIRIGIPTLTLTMAAMRGELMLGPAAASCTIGGIAGGGYLGSKTIRRPDLNESLGRFELRDMNYYTDSGGYILIGPHGADSSTLPGFTGSGVSVSMTDTKAHLDIGYLGFSDTDNGNWIELEGFTVDDGAGGYFSYDTPDGVPMRFDVGTYEGTSRTVARAVISNHVMPRTYSADSLVFCSQDIGGIAFNSVTRGPTTMLFGAHGDGSKGIDFSMATVMDIGSAVYTYNTSPESLSMSGIHIAGAASGVPEDPSTWTFSGDFLIGDLDGEEIDVDDDPTNETVPNPATFDVGADTSTGNASMLMNLPMKGSIRVEDVSFGGRSLGPCAIDGITVHHLNVTFSPN